jgi:hypothetical protein
MEKLLRFFGLSDITKSWIIQCAKEYDQEWKSHMPMFDNDKKVSGKATLGLSFRLSSNFAYLPVGDLESSAFQDAMICMGRERNLKKFMVKQLGKKGDAFRNVQLIFQA